MSDQHPAARAELELTARRRVLAWAAAEGVRVTPAAAQRLVEALRGAEAAPEPTTVVPLAAYRRLSEPAIPNSASGRSS